MNLFQAITAEDQASGGRNRTAAKMLSALR